MGPPNACETQDEQKKPRGHHETQIYLRMLVAGLIPPRRDPDANPIEYGDQERYALRNPHFGIL
jgi:hypothetical protein